MNRVLKALVVVFVAFGAAISASAAWYWPFGYDEDSTNAPPRLHRLLETANEYIELGEDEALNGEADKALDYYSKALDEIARIQRENPDRVNTPEFAPLRNKVATCRAAMDSIRFAQVDQNVRAVAITDTTDLQKRWNRKHGIKDPADFAAETAKVTPAPVVSEVDSSADEKKTPVSAPEPKSEPAAEPVPAAKPVEAPKPAAAPVDEWTQRLRTAYGEIAKKDYAAADLMLEDLLKDRPHDLKALLLRAAAQTGLGSYYAARRTLERAIKHHPKSHLAYYNLAHVALRLGEGAESVRRYYETGRELGGPKDAKLEQKLKDDLKE